ncbi:DUF296 domain-containing protein [Alsobacter metallidurans]|uniref:DUF296 domain-containing protein n=1 Tax=Alsobacter metallidurans TaxID=340221 RepID=A0A917MJQ5_9HYPH|nr:DUF296 domain-containing protein [Alsobacter metallidurans]GGH28289.1 DUF296 domain-containing protein [Alsobacter metallidurans]
MSGVIKALAHPGPAPAQRIDSLAGRGISVSGVLEPGLSINEAIARLMAGAGIRGGTLELAGGALAPFTYVRPALSTDGVHAAWYSAPFSPPGVTRLERANVTFGTRDGAPFVHVHGVWAEADGRRTGGHMMPHDAMVAEPIAATAWGLAEHGIDAREDAETVFKIFGPVELADPGPPGSGPRLALARMRPNIDFCGALVALAQRHGFAAARVRGSVGSLIQPLYTSGHRVGDIATEIFVERGVVRRGPSGALEAEVDIVLVDTQGEIHTGRLVPGEAPVCITFEVALEEG